MVWFRLKRASQSETGGQLGRGGGGGKKSVTIVSSTEQAVDRARMKLKQKAGPIRAKAAKVAKTKKKKGPIKAKKQRAKTKKLF